MGMKLLAAEGKAGLWAKRIENSKWSASWEMGMKPYVSVRTQITVCATQRGQNLILQMMEKW